MITTIVPETKATSPIYEYKAVLQSTAKDEEGIPKDTWELDLAFTHEVDEEFLRNYLSGWLHPLTGCELTTWYKLSDRQYPKYRDIPTTWGQPKLWFGQKVLFKNDWHQPLIGMVKGVEYMQGEWHYVVEFISTLDESELPIIYQEPDVIPEDNLTTWGNLEDELNLPF